MPAIQLIHLINQQTHNNLSPQQIGQTVDLLYHLDYFNNAAHTYGREYLVLLVEMNIIESYVLRKNRPLIDVKHFYVLVEGKVDKSGYSTGADISVERDGPISTLEDCIFLRLLISSKTKKFRKLKQFQHEKLQNMSIIDTKLTYDQEKQSLIQKLNQIQIFSKLPKSDFNQLAYGCSIKSLSKGKISHYYGKAIQTLIYIIDGQIKISLPFDIDEGSQNLDQYLEKYLVKQGEKKSRHQVSANYAKADWIGIEEHFSQVSSKSFGVIMSVEAKVLYIPVELFDKLFNTKINHAVYSKIRYLRQIKADLLQKSSKVQQKKESQLLRWSQEKTSMSPELRKKISKYQLDENIEEQYVRNPQSQKDLWQKKDSNIPTKVVHIVKSQNSQKQQNTHPPINLPFQHNLPQVQRVNLFPQEYSQQFIYPNQMREIQQAEYKKNINMMMYLSPKHHRKACMNSKSTSKNPLNLEGEVTLEKSFFSMSKKVSENFALSSSFYRNYLNKGDEQVNLNFKTISSLEPSRKDLLLKRKSQIHQEINKKSSASFVLPGLRSRPTIKDFQPMNAYQKGSTLDLSQHLMKQKYNIDSNNSLNLRSKQSYQTIYVRNSSSKISDIREYSRTLFVNRQKLEKEMKVDQRERRSQLKRERSLLSIQ